MVADASMEVNMYEIYRGIAPSADEYCQLRVDAGMSPRDLNAAKESLKNSLFSISIRNKDDGDLVAMGRVIGDFTAMQIVDIAVAPAHQGRKLGNTLMAEIIKYIKENAPRSCFVNLFADVDYLYQKFGFIKPVSTQAMILDWNGL